MYVTDRRSGNRYTESLSARSPECRFICYRIDSRCSVRCYIRNDYGTAVPIRGSIRNVEFQSASVFLGCRNIVFNRFAAAGTFLDSGRIIAYALLRESRRNNGCTVTEFFDALRLRIITSCTFFMLDTVNRTGSGRIHGPFFGHIVSESRNHL